MSKNNEKIEKTKRKQRFRIGNRNRIRNLTFFKIVFFQVFIMFYYIILLYNVFKKYFGLFIS